MRSTNQRQILRDDEEENSQGKSVSGTQYCQVEFPKVLRLRMLIRQGILGSGYRIQASSKENDHQAKRVKEGRARSSVARIS